MQLTKTYASALTGVRHVTEQHFNSSSLSGNFTSFLEKIAISLTQINARTFYSMRPVTNVFLRLGIEQ